MFDPISRPFAICMTLSVLAAACARGSSGLLENTEARSASGWTIKVIEIKQPATANIKERSSFGGTQPEKAEAPPENKKWAIIQADITPPSAAASLPAKQIRLVESPGSAYEVLAITGAADKAEPAFVYVNDSKGLGLVNAAGQLRWMIMENEKTGDTDIILQKAETERVYLLFAVPKAAQKLSLQL